jgi:hypothetical protein
MTDIIMTIQAQGDSNTKSEDNHLEIFSLIWLEANVEVIDNENIQRELRTIINHLKKFQDVQKCRQYIGQRSKEDRLVLISSGHLGRELVPFVHDLRQVLSIYIYCADKKSNEQWSCKFAKVNLRTSSIMLHCFCR